MHNYVAATNLPQISAYFISKLLTVYGLSPLARTRWIATLLIKLFL